MQYNLLFHNLVKMNDELGPILDRIAIALEKIAEIQHEGLEISIDTTAATNSLMGDMGKAVSGLLGGNDDE